MSALRKQPMLGVRPGSLCLAGRLRFKLPNWGLQIMRYELADYDWAAIKLPNKPRGSLIRSRSSVSDKRTGAAPLRVTHRVCEPRADL
jgi:hypothetical protein